MKRRKHATPAGIVPDAPAPRRERGVQHIIRTTDAEAAAIRAAAESQGLKKESWARMVLLREAKRLTSKG